MNTRPARGVVLLRHAVNGILPPVGDVGGPEYIHCRTQGEEKSDVAVEKEVQEAKHRAVRTISGVGVRLPLRYSEDPKFSLVC